MKILVTGATGFIGESLISRLIESGHSVIATSRNTETAKMKDWFEKVTYVPFTIGEQYEGNFAELFHNPDLIIHTAWDQLHDYNGLHHIEENVMKHYQFLKKCIQDGMKDITVLGTCFEYGLIEGKLSEDIAVQPISNYGIGKNTLRIYLQALQNHLDFQLKWIRLFYNYGKTNQSNSLFSQLEKAISSNESHFNLSQGDQLRDYLHFDDLIASIEKISLQHQITGIINCCSGKPTRVIELVEALIQHKNSSIQINRGFYPYSKLEPMHFWGDPIKLMSI